MAVNDQKNQTYMPGNRQLLKRSLGYFIPFKKYIFFACIFMVLAGLCSAATAWLVKPALDEIFIAKNQDYLLYIPLAFIGVTLCDAGSRLLQNYLMQIAGLGVLETMREQLYHKVILLPLGYYEESRIGVLMSHIINDVGAISHSMPAIVMVVRQIITLVSLVCVVIYQNPKLAFWALIVLPFAYYPFIYFGRRMRKLSRKSREKTGDITALLQEMLSGIRVIKAFGTEEQEKIRFDKENKRLLRLSIKQSLASEFSSSTMLFISSLGVGLVLWFGGKQVIDDQMTAGTFFSFVAALMLMYDPVKKLSVANLNIQNALAGADRVFSILDNPALCIEKGGERKLEDSFKELRFDHVGFAYETGATALDSINFSIKSGERIALVGPSGAGKTTLVNLIPRFYDPREGKLLLNGHALAEYDLGSLRRQIAIVSQDNFLFNMTVFDNIAYGQSSPDRDACIAAAKAAYAHEFIEAMPEGYDTIIGERGIKLSGGQKQRLTIARAIMKNAPLLILDEATSALDSESEKIVQKALDNLLKNRTSIVIAHRLSTIINADRILVMSKGKILAQGPHDELLHASPLYAKLYQMQFSAAQEENEQEEHEHEEALA